MMKWLSFAIMAIIVLLNFQNCSPSHVAGDGGFTLASIYPYYDEKPTYFESVQLTDIVQDGTTWKYQFVATIVHIDNPATDIDYEIAILDEAGGLLCPRKTGTVNQTTNHIVIDDCQSSHQATEARISLKAKLHTETTLQTVKDYTFDLQ